MPLGDFLWNSYHGFYRPFAFLVLSVAVTVFGPHPLPYHVLNFILFNIICNVVYRLVRSMTGKGDLALLTAALYAVHPVHHPLISNCFVLCLNVYILCGLMSILLWMRYLETREHKHLIGSLLLCVASLLSHLAAVMLPAYLLIIHRFRNKTSVRSSVRKLWPFAATIIIVLGIRLGIPGSRSVGGLFTLGLSFPQYLATLWELLCWYHGQLILPLNNLFLWDILPAEQHIMLKSFNLCITVVGSLYLVWVRWRSREEGAFLAWHMAGLVPLLGAAFIYTPQTHTAIIEPLWFCLSSIGFFGLISRGILALKERLPAKAWTGIPTGLILLLVLLTARYNTHWRTERRYCYYWLTHNPLNSVPWIRWAGTYIQSAQGETLLGEMKGLDARLAQENSYLAYTNRGQVYHRLNQFPTAIADYSAALGLNPNHTDALISRANCYAIQGEFQAALQDLDHVLSLDAGNKMAQTDRVSVLGHLKGLH